MSISTSYPNIRPTLLLDFANSGRLDPRVTFTRASTATYFDETGVLRTAANDTPRFDYDPDTLAARGFLIEEARTNSISNNTMQGAVTGTPGTLPTNWAGSSPIGGLTREVVGTGTVNGINYIDLRFSGTTSATSANIVFFEQNTSVAALNGQSWAVSAWLAVVGGSFTNITASNLVLRFNDSGGNFLSQNTVSFLSATGSLVRYAASGTASNASTAFVTQGITLGFASGVAIDITFRIGLPQLELGAFATSVIPTTTTALTRSADVASVNTLSPWYNASGGTVFVEGSTQFLPNDGAQFFGITDGTPNNFFSISANNITSVNRIQGNAFASGANQFTGVNASNGTYTAGATFKAALAFVTNDAQLAFNGATVGSNDISCTVPTVTSMNLGSGYLAGNRPINGYLRRIVYYPRRLSNAELQAITA